MKDKEMFTGYMSLLGEIHEKKISNALKAVYWKVLLPYSDSECREVFETLTATSRFFPKPGEFTAIFHGRCSSQSTTAWGQVLTATRNYYPGQTINFIDKKISPIIREMGGWSRFMSMTNSELTWLQKEFERRYIEDSESLPMLSKPGNCEDIKRVGLVALKATKQL